MQMCFNSSMPRPAVPPALVKQLQVKLSVVKRLQKEVQYYEKESATQEGKVQKMKEDGKDIYDIKKQEEVLQEFYMMIPNSKSRLDAGIQDLKAFLDENGDSPELADTEALTETNGLLAKLESDGEEPLEKVTA